MFKKGQEEGSGISALVIIISIIILMIIAFFVVRMILSKGGLT